MYGVLVPKTAMSHAAEFGQGMQLYVKDICGRKQSTTGTLRHGSPEFVSQLHQLLVGGRSDPGSCRTFPWKSRDITPSEGGGCTRNGTAVR